MKNVYRKVVLLLLASALAGGFCGCNTMRGLGKDIEKGGQKIQEISDR